LSNKPHILGFLLFLQINIGPWGKKLNRLQELWAVLLRLLLLASFIYRVNIALLKGQPIVSRDVLIFSPRARFLSAK
jgi:hypothetical protein